VTSPERLAAEAVHAAARGDLGEQGLVLVELFRQAHTNSAAVRDAAVKANEWAEGIEREANALAAVVADILRAAASNDDLRRIVDAVVDDLPHDARQRVQAYRHRRSPWASGRAMNSYGQPLPAVPPRASVMRKRERVVDARVVGVRTGP
jgi:hypothetical protein